MESAKPEDWRRPDPANTLYMELPGGRVIIELAPRFAPLHVANIKQLVRGKVLRRPRRRARAGQLRRAMGRCRQDAAHPDRASASFPMKPSSPGARACRSSNYRTRTATRPRPAGSTAFPWASSASRPVRRGSRIATACSASAATDWPDTGSGAELYVVIGQAPRQLDRNIVTVGRVLARHGAAVVAAARHRRARLL